MRIPSKIEYAYKAVLELSKAHLSGKPVQINTIAERYGISAKFLLQVMIQLKNAGLITSIRGASGGYVLAKRPEEITLKDVILSVDHGVLDEPYESSRSLGNADKILVGVWDALNKVMDQEFEKLDFEHLRVQSQREEAFVYTI